MNYHFDSSANAAELHTDCVVVGVYKHAKLSAAAAQIDAASAGAISQHLDFGDFTGDKNRTSMLYNLPGVTAKRVLLIGMGEKDKLTPEALTQMTQAAVNLLKNSKVHNAVSFLTDEIASEYIEAAVRQSVIAVADSLYTFDTYKSKKDDAPRTTLEGWTVAHTIAGEFTTALLQGNAIAEGMCISRDLANNPGNVCTPTYLADIAQELANSSNKVDINVLEEADMEALGMGSFLSVSKGSVEDGKMIILQYHGGNSGDAPFVLVGKGITFDTGGISLKPGNAMDEMKFDMTGAASVIGTLTACIAMQLPMNIIGVIAAAENMPGSKASKPGDIVTSMSGKTIEILNTDAEGRLVLCDALTYVERFNPVAVVDIATLTGACITALGHHICGLLSNNDALAEEVLAAGKQANDEAWRLPMGEKYHDQLKSNFADLANIGGPPGGTITAACFLSRFTESYPWAHLDIAGTAWKSGAAKGATGRPVPLLCQLLINRANA
ncbi:MAG: leucyl aminopeptidase [Candidatus Thiothrix putei]|uniref:Probable cytosol aminopeptidase n=2 Tax=Thiothrix TaxID=1030 RepID=A0A1H3YMG8_9GAMM|nr:leucyl aminopeptidase [Thiothrix caldifontis]WGZ95869.1 MAG: leucyl aminopeptidase [Candidatus Thiothrix putei]SEA12746.1 leucyl aminopeptidase [Thiothrix caldifontis]